MAGGAVPFSAGGSGGGWVGPVDVHQGRAYQNPDISKLTNLPGTWGKFMPVFWGTVRLAGAQIWFSGFRLTEIKEVNENPNVIVGNQVGTYTYQSASISADAAYSFGYNGLGGEPTVVEIRFNSVPVYSGLTEEFDSDVKMTIRYGSEDYPDPIMKKHEKEDAPTVYYPGQLILTFEDFKIEDAKGRNISPLPEVIDITVSTGIITTVEATRLEIESDLTYLSAADGYYSNYAKNIFYRFRFAEGAHGTLETWDAKTYKLIKSTPIELSEVEPSYETQKLQLVYFEITDKFLAQFVNMVVPNARAAVYLIDPATGKSIRKFGSTGYTFDPTPPIQGSIPNIERWFKIIDNASGGMAVGAMNFNPSNLYFMDFSGDVPTAGDTNSNSPFRIADVYAPGMKNIGYCINDDKIYKVTQTGVTEIAILEPTEFDLVTNPLLYVSTYESDLVFAYKGFIYRYNQQFEQIYKKSFVPPAQPEIDWFQVAGNVSTLNNRRGLGRTVGGSWGSNHTFVIDWKTGEIAFSFVTGSSSTVKGSGFFWDDKNSQIRDIERGGSTSNAIVQLPTKSYGAKFPLRDFLRSLYVNTGKYTANQIEFDEIDDMITGALLIKPATLEDIVANTCMLYQIEKLETRDKIKFFRTRPIVGSAEITYDLNINDLALLSDNPNDSYAMLTTVTDVEKSFSQINLKFLDVDANYAENEVQWRRPDAPVDATNTLMVSTIIIMSKAEALVLVARQYSDNISSNTQHQLMLPPSLSDVFKGDILRVKHGPFIEIMKVLETDLGANNAVRCLCQNIVLDTSSDPIVPDKTNTDFSLDLGKGATQLIILDIPSLVVAHNKDGNFAYYYAAYGTDPKWKGGYVTRKTIDEAEGRIFEVRADNEFVVYTTKNALTNKQWVVDHDSLELTLTAGTWDTSRNTTVEVLLGDAKRNLCVYGRPGRYEIMQFASVVDGIATGFVRGCRGTELHCGQHVVGDQFFIVDQYIVYDNRPVKYLNQATTLKATSFSESFSKSPEIVDTPKGISIMPWAPYFIKAVRDNENLDITITWIRRDRAANNPFMPTETPMSEDDEVYEIEILNNNDEVVRTIEGILTTEYVYTHTMQTDDEQDEATTLHLKVYQISALIGRGFAGEATLNV